MMPFFMEKFYEGYNVNFLCFGQTASGKTHAALGPPGTFKKDAKFTGEIEDHFGMFPRAAMKIFQHAESVGAICTIALAQDYFREISCMINDKVVKVDPNLNVLTGLKEVLVDSVQKLTEICQIIDQKRVTGKTGMNAVSSRSHFMIQMKMYTKIGDSC
jgi:hypothetical protein